MQQVEDLRLTAPWPELEAFAASFDLEALDSMGHKHVPYAVLLLQVRRRPGGGRRVWLGLGGRGGTLRGGVSFAGW